MLGVKTAASATVATGDQIYSMATGNINSTVNGYSAGTLNMKVTGLNNVMGSFGFYIILKF